MALTATLQYRIVVLVPETFFDNWVTQVRKGLLELSVLNALRAERLYGYDIVRKLRARGALVISEGTIYPILGRFRREGLVEAAIEPSPDGPARRYYWLTPAGLEALERMNAYWQQLKREIDAPTDLPAGR